VDIKIMSVQMRMGIASGLGKCNLCRKTINKGGLQIVTQAGRNSSRFHTECVNKMVKDDGAKIMLEAKNTEITKTNMLVIKKEMKEKKVKVKKERENKSKIKAQDKARAKEIKENRLKEARIKNDRVQKRKEEAKNEAKAKVERETKIKTGNEEAV